MRTNYILILALAFGLLLSCSKESDDAYSTELVYPEIKNIEVKNANGVRISYGREQKIIVTGNENEIKDVLSEEISETLIIDQENENSSGLYYQVILPEIREVKNDSRIDVVIEDFEQDGFLNLIVLNEGNIEIGQFENVDLLNIQIESEGSIFGEKSFDNLVDLNIDISGTGNYISYTIQANNVIAELSNSGICNVYAKDKLNAVVNGTGSVFYKGDPVVTAIINGSGEVKKVY